MRLPAGARRVRDAFAVARREGRSALVVYLVAGDPDEAASLAAAEAALDAGADLLEIGVPFSDPVADGPVIAAAAHAAVSRGAGLETAVRLARDLRGMEYRQPLLAMGYLNPLIANDDAIGMLAEAGIDALIVPDLPVGEDLQLERDVAAAGLGACFMVAPNTSPARLERSIRASTAFLYVVPLFGVTGARDQVTATTRPLLDRIRRAANGRVPVAVGFGVSQPEHIRHLRSAADGVIVGSAVVSALTEGGSERVASLVADLAAATGA